MTPCQGCGEQPDRCRCDGPLGLGDGMETGFHIWDSQYEALTNEYYEEDE